MPDISYHQKMKKGTVCELLVAADLVGKGWNVYMPLIRNRGHDLIAYRDAEFITLEVKSARIHNVTGKVTCYSEDGKIVKSSHLAIVCFGEPIKYRPELKTLIELRTGR
jgi:hypothetical protein